eukprot:134185_1
MADRQDRYYRSLLMNNVTSRILFEMATSRSHNRKIRRKSDQECSSDSDFDPTEMPKIKKFKYSSQLEPSQKNNSGSSQSEEDYSSSDQSEDGDSNYEENEENVNSNQIPKNKKRKKQISRSSKPATKSLKQKRIDMDAELQSILAVEIPESDAIFSSCTEVRRRIKSFLQRTGTSQNAFCRAIKITKSSYYRFIRESGLFAGSGNYTYHRSYDFFEKLDFRDKKKKSAFRIKAEEDHADYCSDSFFMREKQIERGSIPRQSYYSGDNQRLVMNRSSWEIECHTVMPDGRVRPPEESPFREYFPPNPYRKF